MKIENLEVGKGYKYKELCALLGEKETHNREKQKKKWNRYFVFEQRGQLYYILSVREEPLPDGRSKGNNSKYIHKLLVSQRINLKAVRKLFVAFLPLFTHVLSKKARVKLFFY